jgi:hypothetical protein
MPPQYARSLNELTTLRHSREGGNLVRRLGSGVCVLDSRLRGNDAILGFSYKLRDCYAGTRQPQIELRYFGATVRRLSIAFPEDGIMT